MALVALDGMPMIPIGHAGCEGLVSISVLQAIPIDAVNEAVIMVGQIFTEDGGSHTIDTTGSSSLGWCSGAVTFANAATTVKVGLAAVDTAAGPPARAVNSADVITFDVSRSHTGGGGGITANAWQENVPTAGTKTIANGALIAFCIQMTARGGTDSVGIGVMQTGTSGNTTIPSVTSLLSAAYNINTKIPNAVIKFSDGTLGFFWGGIVASLGSVGVTWDSSSATKEYGNYIKVPFPIKVYGLIASCSVAGNTDAILYSDPLGTPIAEKTVSLDLHTVGAPFNNQFNPILFSTPYQATANQPLAAILKATTTTSVTTNHVRVFSATHQKCYSCGTNAYAVSRASGAFVVQNANKDRFAIGLLVGAFEAGGIAGRSVQINNDSLVA